METTLDDQVCERSSLSDGAVTYDGVVIADGTESSLGFVSPSMVWYRRTRP